MCGIVGYIGKKSLITKWVDVLKKLEYRGYDSSGVAYIQNRQINVIKSVGPICNLQSKIDAQASKMCICHTRWATHGQVNEQNAHPQLSKNRQFAVVHNGIIENYKELKTQYSIECNSETDTEVIANLLEQVEGNTLEKLSKVTKLLEGSYALALIDKPGKHLYIAKYKSPLYVAKTDGGYMVASDISCFSGAEYYCLQDKMIAIISKKQVEFYKDDKLVDLKSIKNDYNIENARLNGYKHYMQKEIDETSTVINNICTRYSTIFEDLFTKDIFKNINQVYLVGCGTAFHSCQMGAIWLQNNYKIKSEAHIASELRYSDPLIDKNSLVILVSQSGETADTLAVAHLAKQLGAKILAITNVEYSSLASVADVVFPLCAGPEIAVASTKAYSAMLAVLYILANYKRGKSKIIEDLQKTASKLNISVDNKIIDMVKQSKRVFFIGRGSDGVTASEGALKLKEIAYLDACGYYAGELKHGTIALIEPNVTVIAIITNNNLKAKTLNAVEEVLSRGASVVVVTDDPTLQGSFDKIVLPQIDNQELKNILTVIPLQKLAYQVSCSLGYNPDKPRNLAKSVTVE